MKFEYLIYLEESASSSTTGYFQGKLLQKISDLLSISVMDVISKFGVAKWFRTSNIYKTIENYVESRAKTPVEEHKVIDVLLIKIFSKLDSLKLPNKKHLAVESIEDEVAKFVTYLKYYNMKR